MEEIDEQVWDAMSKIESAVLGNCLEGVDHEIVEEKPDFSQVENHEDLSRAEMEEIDEQVWDAFKENYDQHEVVAMLHRGEEELAEDSDSEEEFEEEESEAEGKPDGDKIGHLELAWEMLELAKSIWATCGQTNMEAEALHYLGEVSLESNNYSQAVEDLSKAVSIIKVKTAPAGSRALAETHYRLGVAHSWAGNWPLAEKCLADAAAVLATRMTSHPTEKEELDAMVNVIKGQIAEMENSYEMEDSYVKAPGGFGKILSNLGVAGWRGWVGLVCESGKPVAGGTVGTAEMEKGEFTDSYVKAQVATWELLAQSSLESQ